MEKIETVSNGELEKFRFIISRYTKRKEAPSTFLLVSNIFFSVILVISIFE